MDVFLAHKCDSNVTENYDQVLDIALFFFWVLVTLDFSTGMPAAFLQVIIINSPVIISYDFGHGEVFW